MSEGTALIKRRDRIQNLLSGGTSLVISETEKAFYDDLLDKVMKMIESAEICHICGRRLKSDKSRKNGYGPECAAKASAQQLGFPVPYLVGVTGLATSGKDTMAAGLIEQLGFKKIAFADALRRDLEILNPLVGSITDPHGKVHKVRVSDCMKNYNAAKAEFPEFRRLLQVYGTEVHRSLNDNYWIERAIDKIVADGTQGYVFTDMRFPNERDGVGYDLTIRVDRPGVELLNDHASERHIQTMEVDIEVTNNGSMQSLQDTVVETIKEKMLQKADKLAGDGS